MAVYMNKIMLKQHLKESAGSNSSNVASNFFIVMLLKLSHSLPWHEGHD